MSEQELREEIAALRARIEQVDDWAAGVQQVLLNVLPSLLRGHPEAAKVHGLLQKADERYEQLKADPASADPASGQTAELYEPAKMLNRLLGIMGVWPDVDPQQAARHAVERHER